jgi:hypothetical protein
MKLSEKNHANQMHSSQPKKTARYQVNLNASRMLQFKLAEAQKRLQSSGVFS